MKIVAGAKWNNSGAGQVLATYCYYIPLLALNGLTEAFVSSVATKAEINKQTAWMLCFAGGFAGAAFVFLRVLDLGAKGLVWANALNMLFRIIWCTAFICSYLRRFETALEMRDVMPQPLSLAVGAGAYAVMGQLGTTFTGGVMDFIKAGTVSVVFMGVL